MSGGVNGSWTEIGAAWGLQLAPSIGTATTPVSADDAPQPELVAWDSSAGLDGEALAGEAGGELLEALRTHSGVTPAVAGTVTADEVSRDDGRPDDIELRAPDGSTVSFRVTAGALQAKVTAPGLDPHDERSGTGWIQVPLPGGDATGLTLDIGDARGHLVLRPTGTDQLEMHLPGGAVITTNDGHDHDPGDDGLALENVDLDRALDQTLRLIASQPTVASSGAGEVQIAAHGQARAVRFRVGDGGHVQIATATDGAWRNVSSAGAIGTGAGALSWQLEAATGELRVEVPGVDAPLSTLVETGGWIASGLDVAQLDEAAVGALRHSTELAPLELVSAQGLIEVVDAETGRSDGDRSRMYLVVERDYEGKPVPYLVTGVDGHEQTSRPVEPSGSLPLGAGRTLRWELDPSTAAMTATVSELGTETARVSTATPTSVVIGVATEAGLVDAAAGASQLQSGLVARDDGSSLVLTPGGSTGDPALPQLHIVPGHDGAAPHITTSDGRALVFRTTAGGPVQYGDTTLSWEQDSEGILRITVGDTPFVIGEGSINDSRFVPVPSDAATSLLSDAATFEIIDLTAPDGPGLFEFVTDGVAALGGIGTLGGEFATGFGEAFVSMPTDAWNSAKLLWTFAKELAQLIGGNATDVAKQLVTGEGLENLLLSAMEVQQQVSESVPGATGRLLSTAVKTVRAILEAARGMSGAARAHVLGRLTGEVLLSVIPMGKLVKVAGALDVALTAGYVARDPAGGTVAASAEVVLQTLISRLLTATTGLKLDIDTGVRAPEVRAG